MQAPLPGLETLPVSYGTSGVPLNLSLPRPFNIGVGVQSGAGFRPPWPSAPYGYQHRQLGAPSLGDVGTYFPMIALGLGGYFGTVASLYIYSKIFDIEVSPKTLWLGGALMYAVQVAATFLTHFAARGFTGPLIPGLSGPPR